MLKVAKFAHTHRYSIPHYEWALRSRCPEEHRHPQSTPLRERRLADAPKNTSIDDRPRSCPEEADAKRRQLKVLQNSRLKVKALLSVAGGLGKVNCVLWQLEPKWHAGYFPTLPTLIAF